MGQAVDPDVARAMLRAWAAANTGTPATVSRCARALLGYHGIDATDLAARPRGHALRIDPIDPGAAHLTPTIHLPMPFGQGHMTVVTGADACIFLPRLAFSPALLAAAIGRPVRRVTGHRAFDALPDLLIDDIQEAQDADGRGLTIVRFTDSAEPLTG
jgi:hypothetical protein